MSLRKNKLTLLALLVVTVLGLVLPLGAASAQAPDAQRTIKVVGSGNAYSAPTVAYVSLGVDVANEDIKTAVDDANGRVNAIKAALSGFGVAESDIRTENFFIYRETIYDNGIPTDRALFHVSNSLRITIRDINSVPTTLSAAIDAGANAVNNVMYGIDDTKSLQSEARAAAIADARAKAEEIASILGVQVGDVIAINEYAQGGDPYFANYGMGGGGGGMGGVTPPPIDAGSLAVSVSVEVTFAIVP